MSRRVTAGLLWVIALLPVPWISSCWHFEATHSRGFEAIRPGDTDTRVIELMGEPTHVESRGEGYSRFADHACRAPCARRL